MKDYIEERAMNIATYIIENNATVRQTAKKFGVSKSTVHMVVTIWNGGMVRLFGWLNSLRWRFCLVLGIVFSKVLQNHNLCAIFLTIKLKRIKV